MTVSDSTITDNIAQSNTGPALGGGIFNDTDATLSLTDTSVTTNHATGLPGAGGGLYNLGTYTPTGVVTITHNHASTSDDDIANP